MLVSMVIARIPATPLVAMAALCFTGALMVSSLPYCNAKKLKKSNVSRVKLYGVMAFICFCLVILREKAFLLFAVMYIVTGIVGFDAAEWIMLDYEDDSRAREKE